MRITECLILEMELNYRIVHCIRNGTISARCICYSGGILHSLSKICKSNLYCFINLHVDDNLLGDTGAQNPKSEKFRYACGDRKQEC